MKRFLGVLAVSMAFGVQADPRIELSTDTCHFPYDAADTDNEDKLTCNGYLRETAADGAVFGYARVVRFKVERPAVPEYSRVTSNDSDANCVLEDDDGNEYQIEDWSVEIKPKCNRWGCTVTHAIRCGEM